MSAANHSAALVMLRHAAGRLGEILFGPFADEVDDRALVVIPTGPLQSLPWSVLPFCAGRPVTVSPSAALWYTGHIASETTGHVVVAAGPGLPGAHTEAEAVAAIYRTSALLDASASVQAVMAGLDGADVAHLAAHGRLQLHNPLFSSLYFADGPLTVYDLERLHRAPRLVVLAACDVGRPVAPAGDELLGLCAAFMAHGTRQIIASVTPIPDAQATHLMIDFHRALTVGNCAAVALAQTQQRLATDETTAMATAAGFVCIGADFILDPSLTGSQQPQPHFVATAPDFRLGHRGS